MRKMTTEDFRVSRELHNDHLTIHLMKRIETVPLIFILPVVFFSFSFSGYTGNQKNNLNGRVKKIVEITHGAAEIFGEIRRNDEKTELKEIMKYDVTGNLAESLTYDLVNKSVIPSPAYKYDSKGNCLEISFYDSKGSLSEKRINFKYDKRGNEIEYETYDPSGFLFRKTLLKYDQKDQLVEESTYESSNTLPFKSTYKYDENGNETECSNYKPDGSLSEIITYKYIKFDKMGNWINRIEFQDNKPAFVEDREIEY
jgi:hypothetical protein